MANIPDWVEPDRSASNTTRLGYCAPNSTSALPYATLVAIFSPMLFALQFGDLGLQFLLALQEKLFPGRLAVPLGVVFHVAHTLALHRLHQNDGGLSIAGVGLLEGVAKLVEVMAVRLQYVPAKGGELAVQGLGGHDVGGTAVDLQAVHVLHGAQVVQLELGRRHGGLPDLALVQLAVAQQGVDPVVGLVHLPGQGHAHRRRDTLAQRAGGHVHPGDKAHLRMAGEVAVELAEVLQVLYGEKAPESQGRVEGWRAVALGQDKTVPLGVIGVLGVYPQYLVVEDGHGVHGGEGPADVTGLGPVDHLVGKQSGFGGKEGKGCLVHGIHSFL